MFSVDGHRNVTESSKQVKRRQALKKRASTSIVGSQPQMWTRERIESGRIDFKTRLTATRVAECLPPRGDGIQSALVTKVLATND